MAPWSFHKEDSTRLQNTLLTYCHDFPLSSLRWRSSPSVAMIMRPTRRGSNAIDRVANDASFSQVVPPSVERTIPCVVQANQMFSYCGCCAITYVRSDATFPLTSRVHVAAPFRLRSIPLHALAT